MICIKQVTFQDICSVDPLWNFVREMADIAHLTNLHIYHISFATICFCYQDSISLKFTQFEPLGGQMWRCCCEKWGARHWIPDTCPVFLCSQAGVLQKEATHTNSKLRGTRSRSMQKRADFGPQLPPSGNLLLTPSKR